MSKRERTVFRSIRTSMGYIMDSMAFKLNQELDVVPKKIFFDELHTIGKDVPWMNGNWRFGTDMRLPWNEVQNNNKHINLVTNFLIRRYKLAKKILHEIYLVLLYRWGS